MKKINLIIIFFFLSICSFSQHPEVHVLTSGTKTSLRGLSVVNDNIIWVSGSKGMVGKSTNAGRTWNWITVKGYETKEFRDIEAFDGSTALVMSVDTPAYILKTTDGGATWQKVYENKTPGMFLDAMHFVNNYTGMVIGDPIGGKVFMAETKDGGDSWQEIPIDQRPVTDSGEAFFAASGTNIRLFRNKKYYMVSGGTRSRLFSKDGIQPLPLVQGKETTGANSIAVFDEGTLQGSGRMIVVGGDFANDTSTLNNCFYSTNGGKSWKAPLVGPHGYRSCVEYLDKTKLLSCGLNGVDYTTNGGKTWNWVSNEGFHVCRIAKIGSSIFLAGNNGKIAKINWR